MADRRSIGIFDSGLGGLTVAGAVRRAFPREAICYVGDTARVPYGTKSAETVRGYAREIIAFLLEHGVKVIVAACNTVSAAALPALDRDYEVPVLGVVEMGAQAALEGRPRRVGVIGTETTIGSGAYDRALQALDPAIEIRRRACPLFVPLIEEGWLEHPVTDEVIAEYLKPMRRDGIDTLILGCTHYPLLRPALGRFFGPDVGLIDSAEAMAAALGRAFAEGLVPAAAEDLSALSRYHVTDRYNHFQALSEAFLGEPVLDVEAISSEALTDALARREAVLRTAH